MLVALTGLRCSDADSDGGSCATPQCVFGSGPSHRSSSAVQLVGVEPRVVQRPAVEPRALDVRVLQVAVRDDRGSRRPIRTSRKIGEVMS